MRQVDGSARLTGPVEGQPGIIMAGFDLGQVGYTLEEFFLESAATCFEPVGPAGADGYWQVTPSGQAPFATRLVVCRPSDPGAFTGTVILEWLNVSAGFDAPAHWMLTHRQVVRAGWAWAGISAQRAGIEGGSIFETAGEDPDDASRRAMVLPALKESDPVRYGALHHPGDAFCFDIFSQAARAVRDGGVLGPLSADCLLAAGQSQSAIHLVTYVNAVAPTVPSAVACDGYLIGSRTGFAPPLSGWGGRIRSEGPDGARVRTDGRAPVLTVQTESDVTGVLAGVTARQPDSSRFRWWEIAGAAHADTYLLGAAFSDSGDLPPAELARLMAPTESCDTLRNGNGGTSMLFASAGGGGFRGRGGDARGSWGMEEHGGRADRGARRHRQHGRARDQSCDRFSQVKVVVYGKRSGVRCPALMLLRLTHRPGTRPPGTAAEQEPCPCLLKGPIHEFRTSRRRGHGRTTRQVRG